MIKNNWSKINDFSMIVTERLRIVPFKTEHITTDYISWLNDKELMQFSEQRHFVHTRETCKSYVSSFNSSQNIFLVLLNFNGEPIGTMTIYKDLSNKIVDMGILIGDKSSKGKGIGYEAWKSVYDWVVKNLKPRKVTAGCMAINTPMLKLMKSIDMQVDCVRRDHYMHNGKPIDVIYMSKFIDE
jgi:[ribosomal protein S5]-alanine N-acetyltransferase